MPDENDCDGGEPAKPATGTCCEERADFDDEGHCHIVFDRNDGTFGMINDDDRYVACIGYCPWCGAKLTRENTPRVTNGHEIEA